MIGDVALMFMIYGFIGWLWETPYVSIKTGHFVNRGFLRGPFIPIYGFAATTIMFSLTWFERLVSMEAWWHFILAILFTGLIASLWEYVTSYLMEVAFSARWWDYSYYKFNLNGRIALLPSLFWGLGGFFLWYFINPILVSAYEALFKAASQKVLWAFYAVLLVDASVTLSELIQFRRILTKLHHTSELVVETLALKFDRVEESLEAYMDLERLKDLGDFIHFVRGKAKNLVDESEKRLEEFTGFVEKLKKHERFYQKYPHALTKRLPYVLYSFKKKIMDRDDAK